MLNSYGGRKANITYNKPSPVPYITKNTKQNQPYLQSSDASSSSPFHYLFSTLPSIFRKTDSLPNNKQPTKNSTLREQVDLGGGGNRNGENIERDYSNYQQGDKPSLFTLSDAQRKSLKAANPSIDSRKYSQGNSMMNSSSNHQKQSSSQIPPPISNKAIKSGNSIVNNFKNVPSSSSSSSSTTAKIQKEDMNNSVDQQPSTNSSSSGSGNNDALSYLRGKYGSSMNVFTSPTSSPAPSSILPSVSNVKESTPSQVTKLVCDKCDGKHATDNCPYYKKAREDHPDAQKGKQMGGTSLLPGSYIHNARVIRQPGDGSCLFHSMSYGLGQGYNATRLRSEICSFINNNPNLKISDTPLKDWVRWDSNSTVSDYCRRMSRGGWGGGIEMAALSQMKQVNVHVYERHGMGYKRISAFDYHIAPETKPIIRVLYGGGVHYDALVT